MAAVSEALGQWFQSTVTDHLDPRSADWWLCFSPLVPITIMCVYLLLVLKLGPRFMAKREPFRIEPLVILYNVAQITACFYICYVGTREWLGQNYSFACQPVDFAVNERTEVIGHLVYTYYLIKISDLLDTIFFVLRKKFNQVSFLHVYHHSAMVLAGYLGCRFSLNGHFTMIGLLNSYVHVAMYSYYLFTALFPDRKVPLSVKKSLTSLQLAQLFIFTVHEALPLLQPSCQVRKFFSAILWAQHAFMLMMFADFYQKAYLKPKKEKTS